MLAPIRKLNASHQTSSKPPHDSRHYKAQNDNTKRCHQGTHPRPIRLPINKIACHTNLKTTPINDGESRVTIVELNPCCATNNGGSTRRSAQKTLCTRHASLAGIKPRPPLNVGGVSIDTARNGTGRDAAPPPARQPT